MTQHIEYLTAIAHQDGQAWRVRNQRLEDILRHAAQSTQFYKRGAEQPSLDDFPVVGKEIIRDNPSAFIASSADSSLMPSVTSGSYGIPMTFWSSPVKRARRNAEVLWHNEWVGLRVGDPYAYVKSNQRDRAIGRTAKNVLSIDPRHLSEGWLAEQHDLLHRWMPMAIIGYPSATAAIARYCLDACGHGNKVTQAFIGFGEPFHPADRRSIAAAWDCVAIGRYALMELGVVAHECPEAGNYHVNEASYQVELLEPEANRRVLPGEVGRIVVTDFDSDAMPLIRYDTGDLAAWGGLCSCGRSGRTLAQVRGRSIEAITSTDGTLLSPFAVSLAARTVPDVYQFQLVQTAHRDYTFTALTSRRPEDLGARVRDALGSLLGPDARISVDIVSTIPPLGPSGKRSYILNQMSENRRMA
jgi:phenylacetate-CoA ligase